MPKDKHPKNHTHYPLSPLKDRFINNPKIHPKIHPNSRRTGCETKQESVTVFPKIVRGGRQAQHGGWKFVQTICLTHTFPPFFRVFLGSSVSPRWPLCTASSTLCRGPKISSMKGEKRHEKWKKRWSWFWQYQHFLRRATCFQRHFLDFFVFLFLSLFIGIHRVKPLCFCILKGGKEGAKSGSIRMFRQLLVLFRVVGIFFFF